VPPSQILAVTFTNKAADEMKERLRHLLGMDIRGLWVGTFHAICARILRESGRAIDIPPNFLVYDESDQLDLIRQVLTELDLDEKQFNPRAIRNAISRAKERLIMPDEYAAQASDYFERIVAQVYPRYQKALQAANALDFDDLLLATIRLFTEQPRVLERYRQQFRYILVDEYQDVNYAQYVLLRLLADAHRNLCVVGMMISRFIDFVGRSQN
jgi:DNA helicase-2/ATP-dependent DNA helicase PcrA